MNAVLFCNGELRASREVISKLVAAADLLVAVDGGYRHFRCCGLRPHLIVGDMDSVCKKSLAEAEAIEKIVFPEEKDQTDTELAVLEVLDRGSKTLVLLGAIGGRLDHTLGNIELLKKYADKKIVIIEDDMQLVAVSSAHQLVLRGANNGLISIIPTNYGLQRIRTLGLRYALSHEKLRFPTHGISNVIEESPAVIEVNAGVLLVCAHGEVEIEKNLVHKNC